MPWIWIIHIHVCLLYSLFLLFVCLFASFFMLLSCYYCFCVIYLCLYIFALIHVSMGWHFVILFDSSLENDMSVYNLALFSYFILPFTHLLVHKCIIMCPFLHFVVLIICNIYFLCLHVDHDVTNASLYPCLFQYRYAPFYVLTCWYFYFIFLLYLQFSISVSL